MQNTVLASHFSILLVEMAVRALALGLAPKLSYF